MFNISIYLFLFFLHFCKILTRYSVLSKHMLNCDTTIINDKLRIFCAFISSIRLQKKLTNPGALSHLLNYRITDCVETFLISLPDKLQPSTSIPLNHIIRISKTSFNNSFVDDWSGIAFLIMYTVLECRYTY